MHEIIIKERLQREIVSIGNLADFQYGFRNVIKIVLKGVNENKRTRILSAQKKIIYGSTGY